MKKQYLASIIIAAILAAPLLNFTIPSPQPSELVAIGQQFQEGLQNLKNSIEDYRTLAFSSGDSQEYTQQLQQQHLSTRSSFKQIEFLLAYLDHESITRFINGAPLPKTEPHVPEIRIIEPKGLQVLDELVFSDAPLENIQEIQDQLKKLQYHYGYVYNYQGKITLQHRKIFEAVRQELIRIATLGLTGFDTPGSANAIPEAEVAMESIAKAIFNYIPKIKEKDEELAIATTEKFNKAIAYLKENQDFDTFDRLHYLKEYINPLYELTYKCHRKLGIATIEEVNTLPQAQNYHSTNLFAEDFFNIDFFSEMDYDNPLTQKQIGLGKLLFYDPILSSNNQGACVSCHAPEKGFTDGLKRSQSLVDDEALLRNSPTVINALYSEKFFYDLREPVLERQIQHVIKDSKEFATDFIDIIEKLEKSKEYGQLFNEAFPEVGISSYTISKSIAAYISKLRSFNSPFDQYVRGEIEEIDESVIRGFNLFMGKAACGTCHFAPAFNGTVPPLYRESESEVLGVPASTDTINPMIDPDLGRINNKVPIDEAPFHKYSFKTTTVRNIALTAPYMHNGVYETLEEVIDFYNKGGGAGLGLDLENQTLPDAPLNLNNLEKNDLIAFMEALTDTTGMTSVPTKLPVFENHPEWNSRQIGGEK